MSDDAKLTMDVVVNEVGSFDGRPRVSFVTIAKRVARAEKKKRGKPAAKEGDVQALSDCVGEPLADFTLTRAAAQWFGRLLYRRVRITFEDAGDLPDEAFDAQKELFEGADLYVDQTKDEPEP